MPVSAKDTKEIFLQALDHESDEAREKFLKESCAGNEELLRSVRTLLEAHEDDDEDYEFLDSSHRSSAAHVFPLSTLNRERESEDIGTIGDYELLEVIGRGAMGVVYRANQLSLNREVAVKMIRGSFLSTESDVARFRQEAEAAANLKHPNIVPIYEIREIDDVVFFSMELLDGGSMSDRMKEMHNHPRQAVEKLALIARAMHAAHISGIIHRDVKPSNILLDAEDKPYLTDFGLAKNTSSELGHTLSGHLIGTPSYMAPEQASKNDSLTTLADVYSLGAVLYEVLTGRPPFEGETLMEVLEQLRESRPERPSDLIPEVDRDLETVAMKCLEREPANRYTSANRLADELDRWLRGEPIEARAVGPLIRTKRWIKQQPVLAGLIFSVVILLLTLSIGGPLSAFRESRLKEEAQLSEIESREAGKLLREELYASEMRLGFQISEQAQAIPQLRTLLERWTPKPGNQSTDPRGWEWHYLKSLTEKEFFSSASESSSNSIPFWLPDSDRLLIHYRRGNGMTEIWDTTSGQKAEEMGIPSGDLEWTGKTQARISSHDGSSYLLDLEKETVEKDLPAPKFPESPGSYHGKWNANRTFLAMISGQKLRIWSEKDQAFLKPYQLPGITKDFEWNPEGTLLAFSGLYQGCHLWDARSGEFSALVEPRNFASFGPVTWHPNQPWLVLAIHPQNKLRIFDTEDHSLLHEISSPGEPRLLEWDQDGRYLAIGNSEGVTRVWDQHSESTIATFPPREKGLDMVYGLAWSSDGKRLAAGYSSGQVQAWDLSHELSRSYPARSRATRAIWSADGKSIISSALGKDAGLHHVDLESGEVTPLEGAPNWIFSLSQNAKTSEIMASSLSRDKLWLFKPDSSGGFQAPESLGFEPEKADYYPRALFDHTGNHLALVRREMIEIRSYPDGEFTKIPIPFHNRAGQWSPDGRFLITTDGGGFCLIDTQNRELIESVEWQIGASRPSWSPDSKFIAIPHALENKIRIWSPGSKSFVRDVTGHSGRISCASWHPDGSRLATAEGSNILLWDTGTWNVLGVLRKHQQTIRDLEWSPDGKSLLSLGTDQLLVWDLD